MPMWQSRSSIPRRYLHNNSVNGIALLNAALDDGIRTFIFSSSCAVYGMPDRFPISEDQPCLPVNPYGVSKFVVERALAAYGAAYGMRCVIFHYFNAAGADESGEIGAIHNPEISFRWQLTPWQGVVRL
jgi:UDP-glucose 4-epimerase